MKCIPTIFMIFALILNGCNNQEINKVSVLPSNLVPLKVFSCNNDSLPISLSAKILLKTTKAILLNSFARMILRLKVGLGPQQRKLKVPFIGLQQITQLKLESISTMLYFQWHNRMEKKISIHSH